MGKKQSRYAHRLEGQKLIGLLFEFPFWISMRWVKFWATQYLHLIVSSCGKGTVSKGFIRVKEGKNIKIGNNCYFGKKVSMSSELPGKIRIGNDTCVNDGVRIDHTGDIGIGSNVVISGDTIIYTHDHGYDPKSPPIAKNIVIEDDVWIGARSIILPNVGKIGRGSVIGAGSVVTKDVGENVLVAGNPAIKKFDLNR